MSPSHCDGRRNLFQKRSDCHPGNHSSFLEKVPMPQPASDPVLERKSSGSSQAPRPRSSFFLRRICLEDAALGWRISYILYN